jgi:Raf kinase inhibitor-like YbhB/YbcL family protein
MRRQTTELMGGLLVALAVVSTGARISGAQAPQGGPPASGSPGGAMAPAGGPPAAPLVMTTTAWEDGGVIPNRFTQAATGTPVSPELKWSQVPAGTQSFVLLMHDPEPVLNKSSKMDVTHWLVWNLPATSTGLRENFPMGEQPDGTRQVSLRSTGYMGPGAPAGPYHHYTFELYALDTKLTVPQATPEHAADARIAVVNAMDGHVLGKAILAARFHR